MRKPPRRFETKEMPKTTCPACCKVFDATTGEAGKTPKPGSLSLCINCYHIGKFNEQLKVVSLSDEEYRELQADTRAWAEIQQYIKALKMTAKPHRL